MVTSADPVIGQLVTVERGKPSVYVSTTNLDFITALTHNTVAMVLDVLPSHFPTNYIVLLLLPCGVIGWAGALNLCECTKQVS